MTGSSASLSPQLKAIRSTDLSPFIRMSNLMAPRMLDVFLPKLNEKQKKAFDAAMPASGGKKFFVHLVDTPTPPIVIELGHPLKMTLLPESELNQQQIKGLRLTMDDLGVILEKDKGKIFWRLKGQAGVILGLSGTFFPFIKLGPRELKDLQKKAMTHFKPLLEMMPR